MSNPYIPDWSSDIGSQVRSILGSELADTWLPRQSVSVDSIQNLEIRTTTPDDPTDGDEFVCQPADGIVWKFRYNATSTSDYKWEFIGGAALFDEVGGDSSANSTTTSTSPTDLTVVGPQVTVPFAGEYEVTLSVNSVNTTAGSWSYAAVKIANAATSEFNCGVWTQNTNNTTGATTDILTCLANDTLKVRYWVSANTGGWKHRRLKVIPRRIS